MSETEQQKLRAAFETGATYAVNLMNSGCDVINDATEALRRYPDTGDTAALDAAIAVGLEAAYKVKTSGFLGSNIEEKLRVGLRAALESFRARSTTPTPPTDA